MKYICDVCGWEYDEEQGYPEGGIAPGTKWEDVPEDFECPLCLVGKDQFSEVKQALSSLLNTVNTGTDITDITAITERAKVTVKQKDRYGGSVKGRGIAKKE